MPARSSSSVPVVFAIRRSASRKISSATPPATATAIAAGFEPLEDRDHQRHDREGGDHASGRCRGGRRRRCSSWTSPPWGVNSNVGHQLGREQARSPPRARRAAAAASGGRAGCAELRRPAGRRRRSLTCRPPGPCPWPPVVAASAGAACRARGAAGATPLECPPDAGDEPVDQARTGLAGRAQRPGPAQRARQHQPAGDQHRRRRRSAARSPTSRLALAPS